MTEVRGALAGPLAAELAAPMQALRDRLALLVDHLDRYVASSTGPTPYPWQALQGLRHDLGDAYLEATRLLRQLEDVRAVLAGGGELGPVDAGHEVEVALGLFSAHHAGLEVVADLGAAPPVLAVPGDLALVVTRLLFLGAASAQGVTGSAISVRLVHEGAAVSISVAASGRGVPWPASERAALTALVQGWRGTFDGVISPERGLSFELVLVVG